MSARELQVIDAYLQKLKASETTMIYALTLVEMSPSRVLCRGFMALIVKFAREYEGIDGGSELCLGILRHALSNHLHRYF